MAGEGPGTIDEIMIGPEIQEKGENLGEENAGKEEILLDQNEEAKNFEFFHIGPYKVGVTFFCFYLP